MFRINIIGAGRLGCTLAKMLSQLEGIEIGSICNQSLESAMHAASLIGSGNAISSYSELGHCDLLLISAKDSAISEIALLLAACDIHDYPRVVHFSGCLSSDVLMPLKDKGASVASCHPMRSFSGNELSQEAFKGTFCAVEGDETASEKIIELMNALGATAYPIHKDGKASYHIAGVMASNYLIALIQAAHLCLEKAAVPNDFQKPLILSLMQSTLDNYQKATNPQAALTGPIARADGKTIGRHVMALSEREALLALYQQLGHFLLEEVADLSDVEKSEVSASFGR